jgi:hypothetical protein
MGLPTTGSYLQQQVFTSPYQLPRLVCRCFLAASPTTGFWNSAAFVAEIITITRPGTGRDRCSSAAIVLEPSRLQTSRPVLVYRVGGPVWFRRPARQREKSSPYTDRYGGKETLGGLERWFSPRGQDMAFLLSRIGLVRPRSEMIKIKSNQKPSLSLTGGPQKVA